jgi:hypothetical protein
MIMFGNTKRGTEKTLKYEKPTIPETKTVTRDKKPIKRTSVFSLILWAILSNIYVHLFLEELCKTGLK